MREQLTSGDVAARKAYLASVVDAVIVSEDKIRIVGSNDNIRSTFGPQGQPTPRVRKSVQEWCPGAGSNHRHCDFQSHALPTELPGHFPRPRGLGAGVYSQAGVVPRLPRFALRLRVAQPCGSQRRSVPGVARRARRAAAPHPLTARKHSNIANLRLRPPRDGREWRRNSTASGSGRRRGSARKQNGREASVAGLPQIGHFLADPMPADRLPAEPLPLAVPGPARHLLVV